MGSTSGNALKAIGQGSGGGAGTNTSGFSALLAGASSSGVYGGSFSGLGSGAAFRHSTEYSANYCVPPIYLGSYDSNSLFGNSVKTSGYSVRCLKD